MQFLPGISTSSPIGWKGSDPTGTGRFARFDGGQSFAACRHSVMPKPATGSFQIPQAIPAGAKLVKFLGAGGSYGSATYVGRGRMLPRRAGGF